MNKNKSLKNPLMIILIIALSLLAILFGAIYAFGFRYIRASGSVRFWGRTAYEQPIEGTLYYKNGIKGALKKEKDSAICTIKFSNGDEFEGEIKGVKRQGLGKMTYAESKDIYIGDFDDDKISGNGTYTYFNGDVYNGKYKDGMKNGVGKFTWENGSYYYGEFKDNKRQGVGEYKTSDGKLYVGAFENDKRSGTSDVVVLLLSGESYTGKNMLEFPNGDRYFGDFSNDKRTGNGEYIWATGERYVGEFKNGVMDGKGIYYRAGGLSPYEGYFENGNITVVKDNETQDEQ